MALEAVRHPLASWPKLLAPCVRFAVQPSACGKLELCLGGKTFARPFAVGESIIVGDLHNRVVFFAFQVGAWTCGMTPVSSFHVIPPAKEVIQRHWFSRRHKHHGSGD